MRLVLLGGAPGIGKSAVARAVLTHHQGPPGSAHLLQWVDVDALWLHQPWRVDPAMRALVAANLLAVLGNAAAAGVDVALVTWTFHSAELRQVVLDAAPPGTDVRRVQLVASEATWRARFEADSDRPSVDGFYEQRYLTAQAAAEHADTVVDTSELTVDEVAAAVAAATVTSGRSASPGPASPGPTRSVPATWEDLPQLRRLLAAAYSTDALMAWIFRDLAHRTDAVAAWLGLFLEPALQRGAVDVIHDDAGHVLAVCAWRTPDPAPQDAGAPTAAGLLAALVGGEHAAAVGEGLSALRPHAPQGPSAYVQFLAVDPTHQRRGLGGAALQPGLDRAETDQVGVHLETTNPAAVPFYEARGFRVTAELDLPAGPRVWTLARPPLEDALRG